MSWRGIASEALFIYCRHQEGLIRLLTQLYHCPLHTRPQCGGGAFETKGCAANDCSKSPVNNGGSDGQGSHHVLIEGVRINDLYSSEDAGKVGAAIPGNYNCSTNHWAAECCFCKPNGVRASQVAVWVPATRNPEGTHHITIRDVVSAATQADGINLHGYVHEVLVEDVYLQNSGDDLLALWGADGNPENVTFRDSTVVNPGILRPRWYGNCGATYGLRSVVFSNITCRAPTLTNPIDGNASHIDTSMFSFYTSFGGVYPPGNRVDLDGWTFTDLAGKPYTAAEGSMGGPLPGKMAWTRADKGKGDAVAPYYVVGGKQQVNVYVNDGNGQ